MIERITPNRIATPGAKDARVLPVALQNAAQRAHMAVADGSSLANEPRRLATEGPPIDAARVQRLRAALTDGSLVIDPERIAAAMIAAERGE